ncbi:uncharacterized protein LOC128172000 [Crassostrea angulata]|uniref:uncharacterized protein LOC128172000 n=1 Tax=Magallana angulata TaxID=2784310 RepID=UPI0022B20E63|nr:uncharacterized protein LOC128172000 [Crassostrea angulata]
MSGKSQEDYYQVLRFIDHQLPESIALERFVADFEVALWKALKYGSLEHPSKAECSTGHGRCLGKSRSTDFSNLTAYKKKTQSTTHWGDLPTSGWSCTRGSCSSDRLCVETFLLLDGRAPEVLAPVIDYVYRTWIRSSVFKIHHWSVFMTSILTNNDVEGWHNRLYTSVATRGSVPFNHLLLVLHREAISMVSEGKMQRFQRKRTLQVEGRVFKLWNNYCEISITASKLLKGCASIYGPPALIM